jgi:glycosyltransferase involved in cell wall biosynthesis
MSQHEIKLEVIMSKSITVILNGYKRNNLKEQVESIKNQTVPVKEIFYWQNTVPEFEYDEDTYSDLNSALSNYNYGVWARFAYALNARTDYVCVIDDDTIPGNRWLENCLNTYETHPGLLGGIGLRFKNSRYDLDTLPDGRYHRHGWYNASNVAGNNLDPVQVDIVGHSWFFSRDLLSVFWRELPDIEPWSLLCGEDIHFSYMIQKYTDLKTWVPPHPPNDTSMWSSLKGMIYGSDEHAIFNVNKQTGEMGDYLDYCVKNGFKLCKDLNC